MNEDLEQCLHNVSIIGAGGKMGRGISIVLLKLIVDSFSKSDLKKCQLILIDNSLENLNTLRNYLKEQLLKHAERNISCLRERYEDFSELVDNCEIIKQFLNDAESIIHTSTDINCCQKSKMIFEAVFENLELKTKIYSQLKNIVSKDTYFFSNTSSIPISEIDNKAQLSQKIIGFHFYNPPVIQKLVELIKMPNTSDEFLKLSDSLIDSLGKIKVPSNDIAGFIGNGHFIREGLSILRQIDAMPHERHESIFILNEIVSRVLIRPMGMFQLIDYVGLDVFKMICSTMGQYLTEDFKSPLINQMLALGLKGGQHGNGSQKDGFFKYDKGQIVGVINLKGKCYTPTSDLALPDSPSETSSLKWKELSRNKQAESLLRKHFEQLKNNQSTTAKHAKSLLVNYVSIGHQLVKDGVTDSVENVDVVLKNGFYHLYGPGSECLKPFKEVQS